MSADLLRRLLCEVALMRHHVAYGVPPTPYRLCRKGHVVVEDRPFPRCHQCESIARAKRLRRQQAA